LLRGAGVGVRAGALKYAGFFLEADRIFPGNKRQRVRPRARAGRDQQFRVNQCSVAHSYPKVIRLRLLGHLVTSMTSLKSLNKRPAQQHTTPKYDQQCSRQVLYVVRCTPVPDMVHIRVELDRSVVHDSTVMKTATKSGGNCRQRQVCRCPKQTV